jgi:hypothetical protein
MEKMRLKRKQRLKRDGGKCLFGKGRDIGFLQKYRPPVGNTSLLAFVYRYFQPQTYLEIPPLQKKGKWRGMGRNYEEKDMVVIKGGMYNKMGINTA